MIWVIEGATWWHAALLIFLIIALAWIVDKMGE